jgi:hypothetical protein
MPTDIKVIHVEEFLRATVHGDFDFELSKHALIEIAEALEPSAQFDVMIDIRDAPADLTLVQVSQLAAEFAKRIGGRQQVAILTSEDRFDRAHFFAVSARGMGRNVQAFTSFEEAFNWLAL